MEFKTRRHLLDRKHIKTMKRTKLIFNVCFFALLSFCLSYQIVHSKPKKETFNECTNRLGGATDTNCENCEHLITHK